MTYKDKTSTKLKGTFLSFAIRLIYYTPSFLVRWVSLFVHKAGFVFNSKTSLIVKKNLQLCYPDKTEPEIKQLIRDYVHQSAYLANEFATTWLGNKKAVQSKITTVCNKQLIDEAISRDQPVIVSVPHIGNWEFAWHWLQLNYPAIGMYKPANFKQIDALVLKSRLRFGGQGFAADKKGMMGLLKALRQGGVMMMLPDQSPQKGTGIFTPFFNHDAYTMTLLHKLVNKTNAQLLFASCIRQSDGKVFHLAIEDASFTTHGTSVEAFNKAMNKQIETIINNCPSQYLWSYKRFKHQPPGQDSPYRR